MISFPKLRPWSVLFIFVLLAPLVGCDSSGEDKAGGDRGRGGPPSASKDSSSAKDGKDAKASGRPSSGRPSSGRGSGGRGRGGFGGGGEGDGSRGVPVEVAAVGRGSISLFFETQGTLEAENEVDLVSRVAGPIVELSTEEGQYVEKGQLLARIDDRELTAQLEVAKIRLEESEQSFERVKSLFDRELLSRDAYDQSFAAYGSAKGDYERLKVQLEYTRITAPFSGLVIQRYVKFAQHLQNGAQLFRLSDFDPLLSPIQVPERELSRLKLGQRAELTVESFPDRRFQAEVLRISPVVDPASGTVKVTLKVQGEGRLRPGMFASVFLEMANRPDALVVPKAALALDSLGNTVFVAADGTAERRDLELGFRNDELLEVLSGVEEGETLVVVGQDGLSDGTPIEVLKVQGGDAGASGAPGSSASDTASSDSESEGSGSVDSGSVESGSVDSGADDSGSRAEARGPGRGGPRMEEGGRGPGGPGGGPGGRGFMRDIDWNDPEQVERIKERMRERGMSDDQIEERLKRIRERMAEGGGPRR